MIRQLLVLVFLTLSILSTAQPFRYSSSIFNQVDTLEDIEYASADWLNNPISFLADYNIHEGEAKTAKRPLFMDIFIPHGDTLSKRPALIFAHSGGFLIGSRKNEDMLALCDSFARRGYVTATIDYRSGMGVTLTRYLGIFISHISLAEENGIRAFYRATQDSRAAIRFLKHNADLYGIDTSKIYMVGSSAGGFVALNNLYMNQSEEIPPEALIAPTLGNLDTVGVQGYGSTANSIVSMWGAFQGPELIENDTTPVFLIHGEDDDVVPFKKGMPLATLIPDIDQVSFTVPESYGSFCIDTALINRGVKHQTYFVKDRKHEFYGVATGKFGVDGPNEYWDTIQWKISDFLFNQFKPVADFDFSTDKLTLTCTNTSTEMYYAVWDFGDGTTESGNQVTHTYTAPGNYSVQITVYNSNLACDTLIKSIAIGNPVFTGDKWINDFKIYPNPVTGVIYINGITESYTATIYNILGQQQVKIKNTDIKTISVEMLQNGFYILEIKVGNDKLFRKFLKEK